MVINDWLLGAVVICYRSVEIMVTCDWSLGMVVIIGCLEQWLLVIGNSDWLLGTVASWRA